MAISVGNTYMANYSVDADSAAASKLTDTLENVSGDAETLEACEQFEAYLIEQMYKNMEKASKLFTDEEDDGGSDYSDMFSDIYYQSIVDSMMRAGQGFGIAEQLYNSIKQQQGGTIEEGAGSGA